MNFEPTIESQRIFQGKVIALRVDTVRLPGGKTSIREIVEHRGAVCLVALDQEQNVPLVRQYRKAIEAALLEVPAGALEEGEEPLVCAQRELREETGFAARHLEPLATFYTAPGFATEVMYAYLARELHPSALRAEEDEEIELVRVPLLQVRQMIHGGQIQDAKSIASLLLALEQLQR